MNKISNWVKGITKKFTGNGNDHKQADKPTPAHVTPESQLAASQPPKVVSPLVADVVKKLTESSPSIDQILRDCGLVEKPVYHVMAAPVGFCGSPVSFKVTRKYAIGTRITRADGRSYKIYKVKKTKETKAVSTTAAPMWRAVA